MVAEAIPAKSSGNRWKRGKEVVHLKAAVQQEDEREREREREKRDKSGDTCTSGRSFGGA